eukprot:7736555-Lingulodinium_polyedra.AAC.1
MSLSQIVIPVSGGLDNCLNAKACVSDIIITKGYRLNDVAPLRGHREERGAEEGVHPPRPAQGPRAGARGRPHRRAGGRRRLPDEDHL